MKNSFILSTPNHKPKKFSRKNSAQSEEQASPNKIKFVSKSPLNRSQNKLNTNASLFNNQLITKLASSPYIRMSHSLRIKQGSSVKFSKQVEQLQKLKEYKLDLDLLQDRFDSQVVRQYENDNNKKQQQIKLFSFDTIKAENTKLKQQNHQLFQQNKSLKYKISCLESIKYDETTKNMQSYREQYLQQQIQKLRAQIKLGKTKVQQQLEQQLRNVKQQKYILSRHYQAVKIANQCLLKQISQYQKEQRQNITNSIQYIELREKYKRFLKQYRNIKDEYDLLKTQMTSTNNNSSSDIISMSITLTQFEDSMRKNYIS